MSDKILTSDEVDARASMIAAMSAAGESTAAEACAAVEEMCAMPSKRMTNYEKYFGTPERIKKATVQPYGRPVRFAVYHKGKQVADMPCRKYKAWLESGAEDD